MGQKLHSLQGGYGILKESEGNVNYEAVESMRKGI